jgi:ubiquinone/menaquinone biosynthesis C-methylase UbiE
LAARGQSVTAVDMSAAMLDYLRLKRQGKHYSSITIIERDAHDLSMFADASFDGATILLAFYDMVQPRRALTEVIRVLRPGGFLVTTETKGNFRLQSLLDFVDQFLKEQSLYVELQDDWRRVWEANAVLDPSKRDARLTVEEIEQRLRASGFAIDQMKDSHLGQCATIWARKL